MITLRDVAKAVGASPSAVSSVLNGHGQAVRISPELRERIFQTADRLGYTCNQLARAVVTGHSGIIAFVIGNDELYEYVTRVMFGVLSTLSDRDYSLKMLALTPFQQQDPVNYKRKVLERLLAHRVDGVICFGGGREIYEEVLLEKRIPAVCVHHIVTHGVGIVTDDRGGVCKAFAYLASLGHRKIAYKGTNSLFDFTFNRYHGYLDGIRKYCPGMPPLAIQCLATPEQRETSSYELLELCRKQGYTAVICESDYDAVLLMRAGYRKGIIFPDMLSVVGFAGVEIARYGMVPLTTLAQPFEQIGEQAAVRLRNAIRGHEELWNISETISLAPELIAADSTAPPLHHLVSEAVKNGSEIQTHKKSKQTQRRRPQK